MHKIEMFLAKVFGRKVVVTDNCPPDHKCTVTGYWWRCTLYVTKVEYNTDNNKIA
jgi:hypothetical protein